MLIATGLMKNLDDLKSNFYRRVRSYLEYDVAREKSNEQELVRLKIASNNVFGYYIEVRNTIKIKFQKSGLESKLWLMQSVILLKNSKNMNLKFWCRRKNSRT